MIKAKFTRADVRDMISKQKAAMEKAIIARLQYIGQEFVNDARDKITDESYENYRDALHSIAHTKGTQRALIGPETPSFKDQSGNLRSSIGFIIVKNGKTVFDSYEDFKDKDPKKSEGLNTGKRFTKKIKAKYPKGFVLIVVAGMEYAAAVESLGFDVLTGSSFAARKALKEAFGK